MALRTVGHVKDYDGYCDSPALNDRSCRYLERTVPKQPLKHANPGPNSLRFNILPTSLTGSIFCPDFRLSPPMFSIFYELGGGGGGGGPPPPPLRRLSGGRHS